MRLAAADEVLARGDESTDPEASRRVADALVEKGDALGKLGQHVDALASLGLVVERYGSDPVLREPVAAAMRLTARELVKLRRFDEAVVTVDGLLERFGGAVEPEVRYRLAGGLGSKMTALSGLGRHADAEAAADELVEWFAGDPVQGPDRVNVVASGLLAKSLTLNSQERPQDALSVVDDLIASFRDAPEHDAEVTVARAMNTKAGLLTKLGKADEALAVGGDVVKRFGESTATKLREQVGVAVFSQATALNKLGRSDEAIAAWDEVITDCADLAPPQKPRLASDAMYMKLVCVSGLDRVPETVAACQALLSSCDEQPEEAGVVQVADGLRRTSKLLANSGQHDQALAVLDDLIDRCGRTADPRVRRLVGGGMFSRAGALWELERRDEAVAALDDVHAHYSSAESVTERLLASQAQLVQAAYLRELGRVQDSITICDEVIEHLHGNDTTAAQVTVAHAFERKCEALALDTRVTEMLAAQESLLQRFGNSTDSQLRLSVARTLRGKTWCLIRLGRIIDAITVTEELLVRFETETDPVALTELTDLVLKCSSSLLTRNPGVTRRQGRNLNLFTTAVQTGRSVAGLRVTDVSVSAATTRNGDAPASRDQGAAAGRLGMMIQQQCGRAEQALKLTTALVARLASSDDPRLQKMAVEAQTDQISALGALGRWPHVLATASNLISKGLPAAAALERRSERSRSNGSDIAAAGALMASALTIGEHGEPGQAIAAYDAFIDQYRAAASLPVRALVWLARRFRHKAAKAI